MNNKLCGIRLLTISVVGLTTVSLLTTSAMARTFPGSSGFISPCYEAFNCVTFRERLNFFQGLGNSKSAIDYCRAKYGNEATVEWKFGFRWCVTPFQM